MTFEEWTAQNINEESELAKVTRELDANMAKLKKNKEVSADILMSLRRMAKDMKKLVDKPIGKK